MDTKSEFKSYHWIWYIYILFRYSTDTPDLIWSLLLSPSHNSQCFNCKVLYTRPHACHQAAKMVPFDLRKNSGKTPRSPRVKRLSEWRNFYHPFPAVSTGATLYASTGFRKKSTTKRKRKKQRFLLGKNVSGETLMFLDHTLTSWGGLPWATQTFRVWRLASILHFRRCSATPWTDAKQKHHSSIHPCIHSFVRSFVHSFIHSFVRSFIHSFVHSFVLWFIHSFHFVSFHFISCHFVSFIMIRPRRTWRNTAQLHHIETRSLQSSQNSWALRQFSNAYGLAIDGNRPHPISRYQRAVITIREVHI